MKTFLNVALLGLLMLHSTEAAVNIRGAAMDVHQLQVDGVAEKKAPINWGSVGMGAGIGALVAGAIVGAFVVATKKKDGEAKDGEEGAEDEKGEPLLAAAVEETKEKQVDYAELLKQLTKRVTDEVGPQLEKGGAVRNVLETRMSSFTDKAKNFLLSEMNGTAGAVMKEMEAEESMLLLDWNHAVESNFPPPSILLAGILSPTCINFMSFHHFLQMLTVGLPLLILCVWAIFTDWGAVCSIPTIFAWLYTQTVLAFCLFVGHGMLLAKLSAGKKSLEAKKEEVAENLKGTEDGGFSNLKEQFIGNTIILQEALLIENAVRHSFWNTIVGIATVAWLLTTVWNLVLIIGWTFVPGVVAFHPKAAEVAKDEYCGAWATVLVLRISMLLSVLYLFLNLATVVQWACDMMIESKSFSDVIVKNARKADKDGTGLPVVEMLARAFLLRGGDESLISQLAVVQHHKKSLQNKQTALQDRVASLSLSLNSISKDEEELTLRTQKDGGDLAAQVHKMSNESVDFDVWKAQGTTAIIEAEEHIKDMGQASTEHLEKLYENIQKVIEEVENSDSVKAAVAAAREAEEYAEKKMKEAYDMVNDPEFQKKVMDIANQAKAQLEEVANQAKGLADEAIKMASDPELQRQLQEAAHNAMEQAQKAANQAAAAVNDPALQKQLKDAAEQAMNQAKAAADQAAATINDPALQAKMKETAEATMNQVKDGAQKAADALADPELAKKVQDAAQKAVADAQAATDKAIAAASDPKLREAALKQLEEARRAAENAAAQAQDPATRKKFEAQAIKAVEQAKRVAAETGEQASTAAAQVSSAAADAADKATTAAKETVEKAKGKKGKK